MTVETENLGEPIVKSGPYSGDGSTAAFDYEFKIQSDTELKVIRQNADLTETVLTLDTQYTVGSVGADIGGAITLVDPATDLPTGTKLVILFNGDFNQSTDYANQSKIYLATLEDVLDDIVMHIRQLKELAERSIKLDPFGSVDLDALTANVNALTLIEGDISSVAGITADVSSVAAIDTDVTTVAGISADVTSVVGISADVSTVAGIAANVTTVAGVSADVTSVVGISANIATVAGIAADVTTVAGVAADVTTVAGYDPVAIAADADDAAASASAAAASLDAFDDRYLGAKASDPALDNDGDALITGALYWNTTDGEMKVYDGALWQAFGGASFATQAEAEVGAVTNKVVAPALLRYGSNWTWTKIDESTVNDPLNNHRYWDGNLANAWQAFGFHVPFDCYLEAVVIGGGAAGGVVFEESAGYAIASGGGGGAIVEWRGELPQGSFVRLGIGAPTNYALAHENSGINGPDGNDSFLQINGVYYVARGGAGGLQQHANSAAAVTLAGGLGGVADTDAALHYHADGLAGQSVSTGGVACGAGGKGGSPDFEGYSDTSLGSNANTQTSTDGTGTQSNFTQSIAPMIEGLLYTRGGQGTGAWNTSGNVLAITGTVPFAGASTAYGVQEIIDEADWGGDTEHGNFNDFDGFGPGCGGGGVGYAEFDNTSVTAFAGRGAAGGGYLKFLRRG